MTPVVAPQVDVCLIVEGGYPYILGGVASWIDAQVRASPQLKFHVITISVASQPRIQKYEIADNVIGVTDVILDVCPAGRRPSARKTRQRIERRALMQTALSGRPARASRNSSSWFAKPDSAGRTARSEGGMDRHGAGVSGASAGRTADRLFWSWRFLARSLLAIVNTKLPMPAFSTPCRRDMPE
jgi:hypothetical protein